MIKNNKHNFIRVKQIDCEAIARFILTIISLSSNNNNNNITAKRETFIKMRTKLRTLLELYTILVRWDLV